MPELPEVEIAARRLREWLAGERVASAHVAATRIVRGASARAVERVVAGRRVGGVERRGKWLRIEVDGGAALFSHLGMTGKWVRRSREAPAQRHERARLTAGDAAVCYLDQRLFGRLVPSPEGAPIPEWTALGRDPLVDGIEVDWLARALAGRRAPIKVALLDQTLVAGIGNIQATEALWRARIDPSRPAASLDRAELRRLADGIRRSIAETLRREDGPEITYVEEPGAPNPFRVYGGGGHPCPRCRTPLVATTLAGRTTTFCRRCQR